MRLVLLLLMLFLPLKLSDSALFVIRAAVFGAPVSFFMTEESEEEAATAGVGVVIAFIAVIDFVAFAIFAALAVSGTRLGGPIKTGGSFIGK
jgi:hypothetical protein